MTPDTPDLLWCVVRISHHTWEQAVVADTRHRWLARALTAVCNLAAILHRRHTYDTWEA